MPRGLPRSYIKKAAKEGGSWSQIFKRAWKLYKSGKVHEAVSRTNNPYKKLYKGQKASKHRGRKMARRRTRRSRSRRKMTIPIAAVGGSLAGLFMPSATAGGGRSVVQNIMDQHWNWAIESLNENYTGYNIYRGSWNLMNARGLHAALLGVVIHKVASFLGVNRALGRAKIPFLRI